MIISTVEAGGRIVVDGQETRWQCLVRRGMLFSECESIEHWHLPAGAALSLNPAHGVEEAVIVLDGTLHIASLEVGAGQCLLLPHRAEGTVRAGAEGAEALTIRVLSAEVSRRLPPRIPELAVN